MNAPDAGGLRAEAHWRDEPDFGDVEAARDLVTQVGVFSAAEVAIAAEFVAARLSDFYSPGDAKLIFEKALAAG